MNCAIDSTGFKITIGDDYLGLKWNRKRRGWSKLHAVISINDVSLMSFAIIDDNMHDAREGRKILENLRGRIERIFSDKGYNSKSIYNIFKEDAIIPTRNNASSKSRGSPAGTRIVRRISRTG